MKHTVLLSFVLSWVLACLVSPHASFAESTHSKDSAQPTTKNSEDDGTPTQFQLGTLPAIDVGMAVSGSSQKFMRFDRIADKLQKAGRSMDGSKNAEQAERDSRLNNRAPTLNVDPELAPSEGKANKQGHQAVGVSLQTTF